MDVVLKNDWLSLFLNSIQEVNDLEQLQFSVEMLRANLGVLHVVYHWVNSAGRKFGVGTYSTDWVDRYLECNYIHIDPVIIGSAQRSGLSDWKDFDWTSKAARDLFSEAMKFGLGNQGISIPIHGPSGRFALFSVNDQCDDCLWDKFKNLNARGLTLAAHELNQKALELDGRDEPIRSVALSPRELSVLTLLSQGMSRAQAAVALQISEHTLRVYIESARHKLGALNTTHAVARALRNGFIIS